MKEGFRQSMAWLHTWSGLLVGWILFAVFATGTAAYYREEISLWMKPELHSLSTQAVPPTIAVQQGLDYLSKRAPQAVRWDMTLPDPRNASLRLSWTDPTPAGETPNPRRRRQTATLDPATGALTAPARETRGGDFLYRFHFDLHHIPVLWGRWIVGFCAMFMLVAIISGIITHKRIFKDFFTFRPKKGQRSWLDAHNASAVLALPYHLMITYTGLITLMFLYMPWGTQAVYKGDTNAFFAEVFPSRQPANTTRTGSGVPFADLAPMLAQSAGRWDGDAPGRITITLPGDPNGTLMLTRDNGGRISVTSSDTMTFSSASGALLSETRDDARPAVQTRGVMYGLHAATFAQPLLRALFFLSALAGCVMVASGVVLWAVKERQKYAKKLAAGGRVGWGVRLVDGLNIGSIAGIPIAIAAYFWGNRLLPVPMPDRIANEIMMFFIGWGVSLLAGLIWPTRLMWVWQMALAAVMWMALPVLNALTSPSNLFANALAGRWALVGFDMTVLVLGVGLASIAWVLHRRGNKPVVRKPAGSPAAAAAATAASKTAPKAAPQPTIASVTQEAT
ncbi:PepSY-associated TM helix domain-containing protein [Pigmentiphaga aceris]|uniref:PepSY-associated TM helix domain-containing protein n=1 Tax=Pigmentiphaga aceris TaxID=1940612 RepID=UPI0016524210|nr:PepSY-associated TM helix domain-containing protein [Pigmentiphaga aceris]